MFYHDTHLEIFSYSSFYIKQKEFALTITKLKSILLKMAPRKRMSKIGKTGCLFWLFILLVIIVIFVYKGKGNFKETFSFNKIKGIKEALEKPRKETEIQEENKLELAETEEKRDEYVKQEKTGDETRLTDSGEKVIKEPYKSEDMETKSSDEIVKTTQRPESHVKKKTATKSELKTKKLTASLYFVKINKEYGMVSPIPVTRTIEYKDSPITRTIESLLRGPTVTERQRGITSFIPDDTDLISAHISGGHLILNFTHKFEENYTGRDAILLELSQVLLTSFNFNQVTKLSILIEGQHKRYITGEGIPLKEVYTKQDLTEFKHL